MRQSLLRLHVSESGYRLLAGGAIGERAPAKTRTGLIWKGELILPVAYDSVDVPSDGFVLVTRNGKAGFIAIDGTALVTPR